MVAPRPLLFVNSDADTIFPMEGNERVTNRLERIYSLMGAGDHVDSVVSIGEHAYRQDIRQAAFRFMNTYSTKNPPNYVERCHYLLGRAVDSGRVWDIAAASRYRRALSGEATEAYLAGEGPAAVLATYAALLEPDIAGLVLRRPPASHMDYSAPPKGFTLSRVMVAPLVHPTTPPAVTTVITASETARYRRFMAKADARPQKAITDPADI